MISLQFTMIKRRAFKTRCLEEEHLENICFIWTRSPGIVQKGVEGQEGENAIFVDCSQDQSLCFGNVATANASNNEDD